MSVFEFYFKSYHLICAVLILYNVIYTYTEDRTKHLASINDFFDTLQRTLYLRDYIFTIQTSFKFNQENEI